MAGEYVFTISGLSKTYGAKTVLENINLAKNHGRRRHRIRWESGPP